MTVEEMHYEFTARFNSQSSEQQKSYLIPEIDMLLNTAQEMFINAKVYPRFSQIGSSIESTNRIIDDLRTIVTTRSIKAVNGVVVFDAMTDPDNNPVPTFKYFVTAKAIVNCDLCKDKIKVFVDLLRHYDRVLGNALHGTSYRWREVNGVIEDNSLKLDLLDLDLGVSLDCDEIELSYVREPKRISNAANYGSGVNIGYYIDSQTLIVLNQDCELPSNTHNELVDLAVVLASKNVSSSVLPFKQMGIQEQYTIN